MREFLSSVTVSMPVVGAVRAIECVRGNEVAVNTMGAYSRRLGCVQGIADASKAVEAQST